VHLEQIQQPDMPRTIDVSTIQQALAVMFLPTSTSGRWDPATAAGLSSLVVSVDAGSPRPPNIMVSGDKKQVVITPGSFVDDFGAAASLAKELLGRVPTAPRGSNADVLLWLIPMRNMVPLLNQAMAQAQRGGMLTQRKLNAYRQTMDAIDQATFAYGAEMERDGRFREAVMEVSTRTHETDYLTTTFQNIVTAWTTPLPRFNGEVTNALDNLLVAGVLAGVIVASAAIIAGAVVAEDTAAAWQAPALAHARAEQTRQNMVQGLVEEIPFDKLTPQQLVDFMRAANVPTTGEDPSSGFPFMLVGGLAVGGLAVGLALSPGFRSKVAGVFKRSS
jgi:hypothetical protein